MSVYSDSFTKDILENKNTSLSKIYNLLDKKCKFILDVGCSAGYFGNFIKESLGVKVCGIEIDKNDAKLASKHLNKVYSFNLEQTKNYIQIKENFDTMIFADVLEHTRNPEQILKNLNSKLKLDGQVIISFPNVTHQSTILEIISGQWNLENSGIHDKTHIRYFDLKSLVNLIESSGLSVEKVDYTLFDLPKNKLIEILKKQNIKPTREIIKILKKPYSKVFQYIISARKRKTITKFNITQNTLKPATDWISEWSDIYNEYKLLKNDFQANIPKVENYENKNYENIYLKALTYEKMLNKIYSSKTWRLLFLFKKIISIPNKHIKPLIPIETRKKIKMIVVSLFKKKLNHNLIDKETKKNLCNSIKTRQADSIDIINFGIIEWNYRIQRPQHLCTELSENNRIFYIKPEFIKGKIENEFAPVKITTIAKNIFEVTLTSDREFFIYHEDPTSKDLETIFASLKILIHEANIFNAISKIDHPFWANLLPKLKMPIIYDCMDNHQHFLGTNPNSLNKLEKNLFRNSDSVVVTANSLLKIAIDNGAKKTHLITNASDFNSFSRSRNRSVFTKPSDISMINTKIVGYYGAIAEWFDTVILENCLSAFPEVTFVLIGRNTNTKVVELANNFKNLILLEEKPYKELPDYLAHFDVCFIPFILSDLIKATHPVKVFEFLAAGKPTVATKMPEILEELNELVYFSDVQNFTTNLQEALNEANMSIVEKRIKFASVNTWQIRAQTLLKIIKQIMFPSFEAILLSYNSPELLKKTITSFVNRSYYPNSVLTIIDNNSDANTIKILKKFEGVDNIRVIYNKSNLGFAAGNNVGLKNSKAEYVGLINNDIQVTPGWISRMIYYAKNKKIGLVGPVTNNIGNEAKIDISYNSDSYTDLEIKTKKYTSQNWGKTLSVQNVAAFCVVFSKNVLKKIGLLDTRFGIGMFEDDDYSMRVKKANLEIIIADDIFIHHEGSSSFKKMDKPKYDKIFKSNKKKFEDKWGITWTPHKQRE